MSTTGRYSNVTLSPEALAAAAAARAERARRRAEERRRREEARRRARFAAAVDACSGAEASALARVDEIQRGVAAWTGGAVSPDSQRLLAAARTRVRTIAAEARGLEAATCDVAQAEHLARSMADAVGRVERLSHSLSERGPGGAGQAARDRRGEAADLRARLAAVASPGDSEVQRAMAQVGRLEALAQRGDNGGFDRMVDAVIEEVDATVEATGRRAHEWSEQRHRATVAVSQVSDETEALLQECLEVGYRPEAFDRLVAIERTLGEDLVAGDLHAVAANLTAARLAFEEVTADLDEWLDLEDQRNEIEAAVVRAVQAAGLRVAPDSLAGQAAGADMERTVTALLRDDSEVTFSVITDDQGTHQVVCSAEDLPDERGRPVEAIAACRDLDESLRRVADAAAGRTDVELAPWQLVGGGSDHGGASRKIPRTIRRPDTARTNANPSNTGGSR